MSGGIVCVINGFARRRRLIGPFIILLIILFIRSVILSVYAHRGRPCICGIVHGIRVRRIGVWDELRRIDRPAHGRVGMHIRNIMRPRRSASSRSRSDGGHHGRRRRRGRCATGRSVERRLEDGEFRVAREIFKQ